MHVITVRVTSSRHMCVYRGLLHYSYKIKVHRTTTEYDSQDGKGMVRFKNLEPARHRQPDDDLSGKVSSPSTNANQQNNNTQGICIDALIAPCRL